MLHEPLRETSTALTGECGEKTLVSAINLYCWQMFKNEINTAQNQSCLLWMRAHTGLHYTHCRIVWDYWNII